MRLRPLALLIGLATSLLLSGCDTVAVRVLTNYDTFSKLDPKVRANIVRGRVALGYTPEMVRLALGRPNRSYVPGYAAGREEIWTYSALDVTSGSNFDANNPGYASATQTIFLGSVTFRDGKVVEFTNSFAAN
jgi:hypothetical protein